MTKSALQIARAAYQPKLPKALRGAVKVQEGEPTHSVADEEEIKKLFPNTYGMPLIRFVEGENKEYAPMNVGVILSGGQADRPLGLGDGRCGLHGRPQDDGHSAGDAPQNAARVVGLCLHPAVLHHKGVVVFGPPGPGGGEAVPKLHALHGGNAEEGGGQPVFHAAEHGLPQSGGKARGEIGRAHV